MNQPRVKFTGKDQQVFFQTLKKRVNGYFEEREISPKGEGRLVAKSLFALLLLLGPYGLILTTPLPGIVLLGLCVLMGVGMAMVGMVMMHEGCHGAYSNRKWLNSLAANTMYLVGGDKSIWETSHNVLHHSYTNIYGHDVDLEAGNGIIRLSEQADWQPKHRFQHIYAFFLYSLLTITWVFLTDFLKMRRFVKRGLLAQRDPESPRHWIRLLGFKLLAYGFWLVIPLLVLDLPGWQFLIGFVTMHLVAGIVLTLVFQLAHLTEEVDMPAVSAEGTMENSWAIHQLQTTANWGTGYRFWNWFTGGLNHQIEHHLFPGISHIHYPAIGPIVRDTAQEFGIPYHEFPTLRSALAAHIAHLRALGRRPDLSGNSPEKQLHPG